METQRSQDFSRHRQICKPEILQYQASVTNKTAGLSSLAYHYLESIPVFRPSKDPLNHGKTG